MTVRSGKKSLLFTMIFPKKVINEPLMHQLWQECNVVSNTIRGRITERGARLEVKLIGTPKNIDRAIRFLTDRGVNLRQIES